MPCWPLMDRPPTAGSCGPPGGGRPSSRRTSRTTPSLAHALLRAPTRRTGDPTRLAQAPEGLVDRMIADFADRKDGGFFYTAGDHETLIARVKDPFDNAVPGANSLAIRALVGLAVASGEGRYLDEAGSGARRLRPVA